MLNYNNVTLSTGQHCPSQLSMSHPLFPFCGLWKEFCWLQEEVFRKHTHIHSHWTHFSFSASVMYKQGCWLQFLLCQLMCVSVSMFSQSVCLSSGVCDTSNYPLSPRIVMFGTQFSVCLFVHQLMCMFSVFDWYALVIILLLLSK